TGTSASDGLTSSRQPIFSGTAEADATVRLIVDAQPNGTALTPSTGLYFVTPATPLADGVHSIRAQAVDAAGNASTASGAISITIDGTAPVLTVTGPPSPSASVPLQFGFGSAETGLSAFQCSFTAGAEAFQSCTTPASYPAQAGG